jgi:hypothetical protein
LFRTDNPYLEQLQTTYKDLALAMRQGTCNAWHVPANPEKMKRLVLFQNASARSGEDQARDGHSAGQPDAAR